MLSARPLTHPSGSGYIIRQLYGTDADFCERLASELGVTVLDCDYAKVDLFGLFILTSN